MTLVELAYKLRPYIEKAAINLSDEDGIEAVELFPNWEVDKVYSVGDRVNFCNTLYKCIQAHTSQADWQPDLTPALWIKVSLDEFPEWVQPVGAHDAYNLNDKASHNGKRWISNCDGNVWEPSVYGWDEVTEQ